MAGVLAVGMGSGLAIGIGSGLAIGISSGRATGRSEGERLALERVAQNLRDLASGGRLTVTVDDREMPLEELIAAAVARRPD